MIRSGDLFINGKRIIPGSAVYGAQLVNNEVLAHCKVHRLQKFQAIWLEETEFFDCLACLEQENGGPIEFAAPLVSTEKKEDCEVCLQRESKTSCITCGCQMCERCGKNDLCPDCIEKFELGYTN